LKRKHILKPKYISTYGNSTTLAHRIVLARERLLRLAYQPIYEPRLSSNKFDIPWLRVLWLFLSRWYRDCESREIITGGYGIQRMLTNLNLQTKLIHFQKRWQKLVEQTEKMWHPASGKYKTTKHSADIQREKRLIIRCSKIVRDLIQSKIQPEWMVLSVLPVLPPDLRPIVELREGQLITSDLNELYRKVLFRNEELLMWLSYQGTIVLAGLVARLQRASLQRAVDALLANGMGASTFRDNNKRVYKSFSALIKGKKGRFRENLLGKRVDYSGRSVIVVGPLLALHQCGLPREMAIELFQPFMIRELIARKLAPNLRAAKNMIQNKQPIVWKVLQSVVENRFVVLNRAPTLHRLGVQAFKPILVRERAILLHPLVCAGFNADFDGDQMAIHVPLSWEAQIEARILMWSQANLLSPATGRAVAVPSQDMLLGLYILTLEGYLGIYGTKNLTREYPFKGNFYSKTPVFYDYDDVLTALHQAKVNPFSFLWLRSSHEGLKNGPVISSREGPIEVQYDSLGTTINIYEHLKMRTNREGLKISKHVLTTAGRVLFNQQIQQAIQEQIKSTKP
jgi:DNA-directed RNA polymerase beta' subunit